MKAQQFVLINTGCCCFSFGILTGGYCLLTIKCSLYIFKMISKNVIMLCCRINLSCKATLCVYKLKYKVVMEYTIFLAEC